MSEMQKGLKQHLESNWNKFLIGRHINQKEINTFLDDIRLNSSDAISRGVLNTLPSKIVVRLGRLMGCWATDPHERDLHDLSFDDPLALGDLHHAGVKGSHSMAPRLPTDVETDVMLKAIGSYCLTCDDKEFETAVTARRQLISWWRLNEETTEMPVRKLVTSLAAWKASYEGKAGEQTLRAVFIWLVDRTLVKRTPFGSRDLITSPFITKSANFKHQQRTFRRWFQRMIELGWIETGEEKDLYFFTKEFEQRLKS